MSDISVQMYVSEALSKREGRLSEIERLKREIAEEEHDLITVLFNNDGKEYLKVDWARIAGETR